METKAMLAAAMVMAAIPGCTNGSKEDKPMAAKADSASAQPVDSVQVDVSVNKVYDANGNLVGYDSTSTSVIGPATGNAADKTGSGTGK